MISMLQLQTKESKRQNLKNNPRKNAERYICKVIPNYVWDKLYGCVEKGITRDYIISWSILIHLCKNIV